MKCWILIVINFQAATPEFKAYQQQVLSNCKTMAEALLNRGYKLVSGLYTFIVIQSRKVVLLR